MSGHPEVFKFNMGPPMGDALPHGYVESQPTSQTPVQTGLFQTNHTFQIVERVNIKTAPIVADPHGAVFYCFDKCFGIGRGQALRLVARGELSFAHLDGVLKSRACEHICMTCDVDPLQEPHKVVGWYKVTDNMTGAERTFCSDYRGDQAEQFKCGHVYFVGPVDFTTTDGPAYEYRFKHPWTTPTQTGKHTESEE